MTGYHWKGKPEFLKVWGWTGQRSEARQPGNPHGQTREIVAAKTQGEMLRIVGMTRNAFVNNGCETGNDGEIAAANAKPRKIFWRPLNAREDDAWIEA